MYRVTNYSTLATQIKDELYMFILSSGKLNFFKHTSWKMDLMPAWWTVLDKRQNKIR